MLKEFIDDYLTTGTICPSQSPIKAPALFVKRKDSALCIVVDYQILARALKHLQYSVLAQVCKFLLSFYSAVLDIIIPMTHLLWKDAPWCFNTHCKSTFNMLKLVFTTAPVLAH